MYDCQYIPTNRIIKNNSIIMISSRASQDIEDTDANYIKLHLTLIHTVMH